MESLARSFAEQTISLLAEMDNMPRQTPPPQPPHPPLLTYYLPNTPEYVKFQNHFKKLSQIGRNLFSSKTDPSKRFSLFAQYFDLISRIKVFFKWHTDTDYVADGTYVYVLIMKGLALCVETIAKTNTAGAGSKTTGLKLEKVPWPNYEARFQNDEEKLSLERIKEDARKNVDQIMLRQVDIDLQVKETEKK